MADKYRQEEDFLGKLSLPENILYGINTARAIENFPVAGRKVHGELIKAYGTVKLACLKLCIELGCWKELPDKAAAMLQACSEMSEGLLNEHIVVDMLQGGAGTSTNMNVNEVIANRALNIMGLAYGRYDVISPNDDVNRYQSTNDTYPTALRLAAIRQIQVLEQKLIVLQEAFQRKEKEFAHIVKIARTEMQDAVLTTLGREMGAYAEAFNRDRWRVYKCIERLRVVNLGGTAIGTGLAAPRQYIFGVVDKLRDLTGIGFARAENLIDATQNCDVFVEVSGILKALASSLIKVSNDLRLLSSGPQAGLSEIQLPARQAGSSIMPGKVNPVIPEAVCQGAMAAIGYDASLTMACASGSLELNALMPLIACNLLDMITVLSNSCDIFARLCVEGIEADEERCRQTVENSTAAATALINIIGYQKASLIAKQAIEQKKTIRQVVVEQKIMNEKDFDALLTPEAVTRLGFSG